MLCINHWKEVYNSVLHPTKTETESWKFGDGGERREVEGDSAQSCHVLKVEAEAAGFTQGLGLKGWWTEQRRSFDSLNEGNCRLLEETVRTWSL